MNRFLRTARRMFMPVTTGWIVCAGFPMVAQAQVTAVGSGAKAYVNQYGLVIILLAMGLIIVCMPSRRAEEPKFKREFQTRH